MSEEKSGGFFNALKSLVVAEDESEPKADVAVRTTVSPVTPLPPPPPAPGARPPADPEFIRKIDERTTAQLQAPVEKVAGTYAEFMASMDALAEAVPDVQARQKAVIKLMTKKKIPLAKILSDLDACIGALEAEGRTFRDQSGAHLEKKIGGMKHEVESIDLAITSKESQVVALQGEISAHRASRSAKEAEIREASESATLVQSRFAMIYDGTHAAMTSQRKQISDLVSKEAT